MRTTLRWKPNLSAEKRLARKQFLSERSRKGVEARERKRLERTKDEPIRQDFAGLLLYTLTVHNRRTGKMVTLDFRVSAKRVNSFAVDVDGKPWRKRIGMTEALDLLRARQLLPARAGCIATA